MSDLYNVGRIGMSIETINDNSVSNIEKVIRKLNTLNKLDKNVLETFNSINRLGNGLYKVQKINLSTLESQLESISEQTKKLNLNLSNIEQPKFTETATSLNKLANALKKMNNLKNLDFRGIYNSFSTINRILDPFLQKLKNSEDSLKAMASILNNLKTHTITKANKELDKVSKTTKNIGDNAEKSSFSFSKIFNIGKIYFLVNYFKQLGRNIANIVNTAITFEETLNKFQVSMGQFSKEAESYANNLAYAFNLSRQSLMDYMSTYNSMLKSLGGLNTNQAYELSKTLTQLALDYASLFNVSVDRAMTSFQAVLSGQIRQIRSVSGIDVSENTIFQYYQELGGTKTMRQLSQLEKRLLRIYALEKQMNELGAVGDLQKTIDSSSNMIKQLQETWKEAFVFMGNIALKYFQPVLKTTLSISLAIKDMFSYIAKIMDATTKEYNQDNYVSLFGEDVENTIESTKELMGLLSFDKFEVLNSTGASETTSEVESISNAIAKLETDFSLISSSARDTADSILKWLGFEKTVNDETQEVSWNLKDGFTNLKLIEYSLKTIASLGIGLLLEKSIVGLVGLSVKLFETNASLTMTQGILKSIGKIGLVAGILMIIEGLQKGDKLLVGIGISLTTIGLSIKAIQSFKLTEGITNAIVKLSSLNKVLNKLDNQILGVSIGLGLMMTSLAIFNQMDKWSAKTKLLVGSLTTLASAILGVAVATMAMNSALSWGTAVPIILGSVATGVAGITALTKGAIESTKGIEFRENGGFVSRGQLFVANEKGAELVGSMDGKTAVANNQMIVEGIKQASYEGFMRAFAQNEGMNNVQLNFNVSDSAVARALFNPMIEEARRKGYSINSSKI